jgi:DNA-binding SARP family transcriptional activator
MAQLPKQDTPRGARKGNSPTVAPVSDPARISCDDLVRHFPYGIATFDRDGVLTSLNRAGRELLGELVEGFERRSVTCCDLFGCGSASVLHGRCLTELVLERNALLPEVRLDIGGEPIRRAVWVAAAPLAVDEQTIAAHLRPGDPRDRRQRTVPHWTGDRRLRITALGRTEVWSAEGSLGGNWLGQRSGELLKYLVAERHRVVYADEIAEALWPRREQGVLNNVRYYVHSLRVRLEPDRAKRGPSAFIISDGSGYRLNPDLVTVDADLFEQTVRAARNALAKEDAAGGKRLLEESVELYVGDFVADEPYALWVFSERERLRGLASDALETLAGISLSERDWSAAMAHLERLAQMRPFDSDVERRLIKLALSIGQQTYARRRYAAFRMRVLREGGQPPDFDLTDLIKEHELATRAAEEPPPERSGAEA